MIESDQRRSRRTVLGIVVMALVVLLQLLAQLIGNRDTGRFASVLLYLTLEMPPLIVGLSRLFYWVRRRELGAGALAGLGLLYSGLLGSACGGLFWLVEERFPALGLHTSSVLPPSMARVVLFGFTQALSHFGLWTLAFVLPQLLDDARVRTLEADKLRLEAEQLRQAAELARLRAHLEPHFLLNTLNAIAGLVTEDAREARRLLAALGDLLRDALRDEDELQTLEAQMSWLRRYAEILEMRHRGELSFVWEIGPGSGDVLMPRLLLQPLVENAVKHGALKRGGSGRVSIRAALSPDASALICTVEDNGPGVDVVQAREGAFGLKSVRRRLELRYGSAGEVQIESTRGGTRSTVVVPLQAGSR